MCSSHIAPHNMIIAMNSCAFFSTPPLRSSSTFYSPNNSRSWYFHGFPTEPRRIGRICSAVQVRTTTVWSVTSFPVVLSLCGSYPLERKARKRAPDDKTAACAAVRPALPSTTNWRSRENSSFRRRWVWRTVGLFCFVCGLFDVERYPHISGLCLPRAFA